MTFHTENSALQKNLSWNEKKIKPFMFQFMIEYIKSYQSFCYCNKKTENVQQDLRH